ncbi:MAG: nucleotidyltransferase domain-containing protein [Clostridia bacterium]|nr:nucleotidyltransferase domain-containing protein [Clostridia bacterium]
MKEVIGKKDADAKVYLFGSRVYDDKKGGDIDLLIFSEVLSQQDASKIRYDLWDEIGEQKIDILIVKDTSHPFTKIALKEGILL